MSLGPAEILMVLLVALVLFGPKKLPEVGRQVGGALRELRKIQESVQHEIRSVMDETVGPIRTMTGHEPKPYEPTPMPYSANPSPSDPVPHALAAGEPDLGDETNGLPAPGSSDDSERGIDGLSGGTFS